MTVDDIVTTGPGAIEDTVGTWRNNPRGFQSQTKDFVKGVKGDEIEFGYSGQHVSTFKVYVLA